MSGPQCASATQSHAAPEHTPLPARIRGWRGTYPPRSHTLRRAVCEGRAWTHISRRAPTTHSMSGIHRPRPRGSRPCQRNSALLGGTCSSLWNCTQIPRHSSTGIGSFARPTLAPPWTRHQRTMASAHQTSVFLSLWTQRLEVSPYSPPPARRLVHERNNSERHAGTRKTRNERETSVEQSLAGLHMGGTKRHKKPTPINGGGKKTRRNIRKSRGKDSGVREARETPRMNEGQSTHVREGGAEFQTSGIPNRKQSPPRRPPAPPSVALFQPDDGPAFPLGLGGIPRRERRRGARGRRPSARDAGATAAAAPSARHTRPTALVWRVRVRGGCGVWGEAHRASLRRAGGRGRRRRGGLANYARG